MDKTEIFTTTLRLNPESERALKTICYLKKYRGHSFRSYTDIIITAVNSYFDNLERMSHAPFFGSPERDCEFFGEISTAVRKELSVISITAAAADAEKSDIDEALEFADSL